MAEFLKMDIQRFSTGSDELIVTADYRYIYGSSTEYVETIECQIYSSGPSISTIYDSKGKNVTSAWGTGTWIVKNFTTPYTDTLTFVSEDGQTYSLLIEIYDEFEHPSVDKSLKLNKDISINGTKYKLSDITTKMDTILAYIENENNYGYGGYGTTDEVSTTACTFMVIDMTSASINNSNIISYDSTEKAIKILQDGIYELIVQGRFSDTASATTSMNCLLGIAYKTADGSSYVTTDDIAWNSWQDNNYRLTSQFIGINTISEGTYLKLKTYTQSDSTIGGRIYVRRIK